MQQACDALGVKHIFSPVYTPESNERLEGWHQFFKACIAKHIRGGDVEWDELVPLAVSAYNFFPCQSSKESPFVMMFGRDPIKLIAKLLELRPRYYGERGSELKMDTLRRLYLIVVENIRRVCERKANREEKWKHTIKVNDMVLVRDPDSAVFEPRYQPNFRVTAIYVDNRIEVQDEKGHKSVRRSSHVKYVEPSEKVIQQLPSRELLTNYGRTTKLLLAQEDIPDLHLNVRRNDNGDFQENCCEPREGAEVVEVMESSLLEVAQGGHVTDVNSDYWEYSRNSLLDEAGGALG